MTISLETACERILGKGAAQAIIEGQGLRWAIVAATAAARTTDDAEAIAELRRYPHAMQMPEIERHDAERHARRRAEEAQYEEDHAEPAQEEE